MRQWFTVFFAIVITSRIALGLETLLPEERAWLEEHPVIRVTNENDYPPFDYAENGVPRGFSIDYMDLLEEKLGVQFDYVNGYTWDELLSMMRNKELDVVHTLLQTPQRSEYLLFTEPYFVNPYVLVVPQSSEIDSLQALEGKTIATVEGFVQQQELALHYPGINQRFVDSPLASLEALAFGQVDGVVESLGLVDYLVQTNMLTNLRIVSGIDTTHLQDGAYRLGVRDDWPMLVPILQKAMDAVTTEEIMTIRNKWFSAEVIEELSGQFELTDAEEAWIRETTQIRLTGIPERLPFETFLEDGTYVGLVPDYINLIEQRLEIVFTSTPSQGYTDAVEKALSGEVDVISSIPNDTLLSNDFVETTPFLDSPVVMITRENETFISNLSEVLGKSIGYVRTSGIGSSVQELFPTKTFTEFQTTAEALQAVAENELDILLSPLAQAKYSLAAESDGSLVIAGKTEISVGQSLYVRQGLPELVSILNKSLRSISMAEQSQIMERWTREDVVIQKVDYELLIELAIGFLVILAMAMIWNYRMAREVRTRKQAEAELQQSETKIRSLLESAPDGMVVADEEGKITIVNHAALVMFGYEREELEGQHIEILLPEDKRGSHIGFRQMYNTNPETRQMGDSIDLHAMRKDGSIFPVEISLSPVDVQGGMLVSAVVRDVTERNRRQNLSILSAKVAEALSNCETIEEMLQACADTILRYTDSALVRLWNYDEENRMLLLYGSAGMYTHKDGPHSQIPLGRKKVGYIAESRLTLANNDIQNDALIDDKQWAKDNNLVGFIGFPLQEHHTLMGVFVMFSHSEIPRDVCDLLEQLGGNIAIAIARKKAEEEVRAKEERFRAIADYSSDWEWWLGTDAKLLWTNPACESITGYSQDECLSMPNFPAILLSGEYRTRVADALETSLQEKTSVHDLMAVFSCKDGSETTASISWQPIYDSRENYLGIRASVRDSTERVAAEEKIRKMSIAVTQSPSAVMITTNQGEIEYVNPRFEEVTGYSSDEVIGKSPSLLSSGQHSLEYYKDLWDTILRGQTWRGEFCNRKKNGELYWDSASISPIHDSRGMITHFIETAEDITERKKAEEQVRQSKQFLEGVINNSPTLIYAKNTEGEYLIVNREWCERKNFSPDLVLGRTDFDLFSDEVATVFREKDLEVMESKQIIEYEQRIVENGKEQYYNTLKFPLLNPDGSVHAICGISSTITDRKRMEEELRRASIAAEEASRSKSSFLANMSHEIRTPLNAIIGFSQLLQQDDSLSDEQKNNLGIVCRSGDHLLNLINDILDMSKIEAGRIQLHETSFDLLQSMNDLESMFHFKAQEKNLELSFTFPDSVPQYIHCDEKKLRQIVVNLVSNAIKFTDSGGVQVRGNYSPQSDSHGILSLAVEDSGVGIGPEEISKLFSAFAQTESGMNSKQGTGLGLAISREFAQLMGGDITVESTKGSGTTFTCTLVVHPVDASEVDHGQDPILQEKPVALKEGQGTKRILIVDDTDDVRSLMRQTLEPFGFELNEAVDGDDAVEKVKEWNPDLVFMDIQMPVKNGFAATADIRNLPEGNDVPVIAVSASVMENDRQRIFDAGCNGFIQKPFRDVQLIESLERHLNVEFLYESVELSVTPAEAVELLRSVTPEHPILVLDDYPMNRQVAQKQLASFGLDCELAVDGIDGLEKARANRYSVIFSDLSMPNMDGYEFAKAYRQWEAAQDFRTPVIAMSAHVLQEEARRCRECGMDDFIGKPVTIEALALKLVRWFNEAGILSGDEVTTRGQERFTPQQEKTDEVVSQDESTSESTETPVDMESLKDILGEEDDEGLFEMLQYFREDFDGLMESLEQALKAEDRKAIRDTAHTAKGGAGNAAAFALAETMKQLQVNAFDLSIEDLTAMFTQAKQQYNNVQLFIDAFGKETTLS